MSSDTVRLQPLTIYPRHKDFRDPTLFLRSLYERPDYKIEERGSILVQIPHRFVHQFPPEVDQSASLSWVVEQHLSPHMHPGVWLCPDIKETQYKYTVRRYLLKIGELEDRCDVKNFFQDRMTTRNPVLDACYLKTQIFKNGEQTFRNLPEWNFSGVRDLIEECWGHRERGFFISNVGSLLTLQYPEFNFGHLSYLHWGAPKMWTVVPANYFRTLQNCIYQLRPELMAQCPALHYFAGYLEPSFFEEHRIPYVQFEQHPGQMLVFAYQAQFQCLNTGISVSENCNYAEVNWLRYAAHQVRCKCPGSAGKDDDAREMKMHAFRKYLPGVNPDDVPDPTDNGKWYCARSYLPEGHKGKEYEKSDQAFCGLPESGRNLSESCTLQISG